MNFSRSFTWCGVLAASVTLALGSFAIACAANTAPEITAFDQAFAAVNDYTCVLHVHEAKGTATQDRVYQYSFMKPHYAKTLILDGDGKVRAAFGPEPTRSAGIKAAFFRVFTVRSTFTMLARFRSAARPSRMDCCSTSWIITRR